MFFIIIIINILYISVLIYEWCDAYFIMYNDRLGNTAYTSQLFGTNSLAKHMTESDNKLKPAIIFPQNWKKN